VELRRAVALLNGIFTTLGLEKHPNKTFIGRVEKGFDFLGYHLWPDRLTVAQATVERFLARVTRLYEQEQGRPLRSARSGRTCGAGRVVRGGVASSLSTGAAHGSRPRQCDWVV